MNHAFFYRWYKNIFKGPARRWTLSFNHTGLSPIMVWLIKMMRHDACLQGDSSPVRDRSSYRVVGWRLERACSLGFGSAQSGHSIPLWGHGGLRRSGNVCIECWSQWVWIWSQGTKGRQSKQPEQDLPNHWRFLFRAMDWSILCLEKWGSTMCNRNWMEQDSGENYCQGRGGNGF